MMREFYFKLVGFIPPSISYLFLILLLSMTSVSLSEPYWIAFIPGYDPGTLPIISAQENGSYETIIQITIPGMWVEDVEIDGIIYQRLEIPNYSTLMEENMPALPAIGGLVGYSEVSDTSINYIDDLTMMLMNYNVIPFHDYKIGEDYSSFFETTGLKKSDIWYPLQRADVSYTMLLRDILVSHFGIVPFEYNALQRLLKVHPVIRVFVEHTTSKSGEKGYRSDGTANPTLIPMYENLIVNYSNLGLQPIDTSLYDYLILTTDDLSGPANDLYTFLISKSYRVLVHSEGSYPDWQYVYNVLQNLYSANGFKYVLLIGDETKIPVPVVNYGSQNIPSDYVYSCLAFNCFNEPYDDYYNDVDLGRLSVRYVDDAQRQINKIEDHYQYRNNSNILKNLFIGSYNWDPKKERNIETKIKIRDSVDYQYDVKDNTYLIDGSDRFIRHNDNEIIMHVNSDKPMLINYNGHGTETFWADWDCFSYGFFEEPNDFFKFNDIDNINPGNLRPVVFSIACSTANIKYPECFCEHWMSASEGCVGILGSTIEVSGPCSNAFDIDLYYIIYGKGEGKLGRAIDWARLYMLSRTYYYDPYHPYTNYDARETAYSYLLFGDPTLYILPGISDKMNYTKPYKINIAKPDFIKPEIKIYPNPVYDNFNINILNMNGNLDIRLYDISGRLVYERNIYNNENNMNININPSEIGLSYGLYFIDVSSKYSHIVKKILYVR